MNINQNFKIILIIFFLIISILFFAGWMPFYLFALIVLFSLFVLRNKGYLPLRIGSNLPKHFPNYSINRKELVIHDNNSQIIIKYYDLVDAWIDKNEIILMVNEELKKTGIYNRSFSKEYTLIAKEDAGRDFESILNYSKLKLDMTPEESKDRNKRIKELFDSERLESF